MPVANDEADKSRVAELFKEFEQELTLSWGAHPIALPHQFGIVTTHGISKRQAAQEIEHHLNIHPAHFLGIGDSTSDWQFMQDCGYVSTVENGSNELKELITSKDKHFIGGHVDGTGVLDIFAHWGV
jgi:hydroxymethylpyrimidine pyrophosphatase-like HAD family hydrolase